jgi:apolipoprotein N-acyltransferase
MDWRVMSNSHRARIYNGPLRVMAGSLALVSGASLIVMLGLLLLPSDVPANPLRLIRQAMGFCLLPALSLFVLRRTCAATIRVEAGGLVIDQRHRRVEVPVASIVGVEPWRLLLPEPGLGLRLRSGASLADGIALEDPTALIGTLVEAGASDALLDECRRPTLVYARAKAESGLTRGYGFLLKFPIFALVPTVPLFRVHQLIAYGGAFGEYYQYGLGAYLLGFAVYWATLIVYLLLYAAALRVPVELIAALAAFATPDRAVAARRVMEKAASVCFYVGVPTFVVLRFIPW